MLTQIGLFLIQTIFGFLIFIFLLRFYAFACRVNLSLTGHQAGQFIYALSDWAVLPLRRLLPKWGRLDLPSLLPAIGLEVILSAVSSFLLGAWHLNLPDLLLTAVFALLSLAISGLMGLVIVYALLSLVQPHSPLFILMSKLCEPFLQPLRRFLPLIGGIDLSAFVALMVFQIALMIIKSLHLSALY